MEEFPGNSHTSKMQKDEPESETTEATEPSEQIPEGKVKKVVNGKVIVRRKPLIVRLKEMFAPAEGDQSFMDYLVTEVTIPMIQETIVTIIGSTLDGIKNGVEDRVTGGRSEGRTNRVSSYGTGKRVDYNAQYRSSNNSRSVIRTSAPAPRITVRRSNQVQDIILATREEGLDVIEELGAKIDDFGHCTVGDLYSATGVPIKSTDESWGWVNLDEARVRRLATDQFLLLMPRPIAIQFEN